jgi:hypothetical protein
LRHWYWHWHWIMMDWMRCGHGHWYWMIRRLRVWLWSRYWLKLSYVDVVAWWSSHQVIWSFWLRLWRKR